MSDGTDWGKMLDDVLDQREEAIAQRDALAEALGYIERMRIGDMESDLRAAEAMQNIASEALAEKDDQ